MDVEKLLNVISDILTDRYNVRITAKAAERNEEKCEHCSCTKPGKRG
jgi:hypothetical protein